VEERRAAPSPSLMRKLSILQGPDARRILFLGRTRTTSRFGCGRHCLRLAAALDSRSVGVFSATPERAAEARASAAAFPFGGVSQATVVVPRLPGRLPCRGRRAAVKEELEAVKGNSSRRDLHPLRGDLHQDHG